MTTQHDGTNQHTDRHTDQHIHIMNASGAAGTSTIMTLEQLLSLCVQLQPVEAAVRGDSALCVTPLITAIFIDGKLVELKLKGGRWGAGYTRVSGEVQRAAGSAAGKTKKNIRRRKSTQQVALMQQMAPGQQDLENAGKSLLSFSSKGFSSKGVADGYSEEEQLTRQIRHFVQQGQAFRIYSDCGLTGEYPSNDPRLIKKLLEGKAARYKKIYERTLLDETSLLRRTPEQIASMRAYLAKRVAQIKGGQVTDNEFAPIDHVTGDQEDASREDDPENDLAPESDLAPVGAASRGGTRCRAGRPRRKVYFRQAFTQLWRDIQAGKVDAVAVSDRSRLCRAADLESEFLMLLGKHQTRLVGLIEDLSTLDVSDPLKKGFAFLIASVNEYRLEEVSGHSLRGLLQLLESGHPHGRPPWWLLRDAAGKAVEMPAYVPHARRVVELYLAGLGPAAIVTKLHDEGVRIGGEPLTRKMVFHVLDSDATSGLHWQFGLAWDIYPPLLPPDTVAELRERRQSRRDILIPQFGARQPGRTWANHAFTGLLRCGACGYLLRYSQPSRTQRSVGHVGYYYCPAPHKRAEGAPAHAYMNETKLSAFLDELLSENPRLIADALSAGGDRAARSSAQRALLEERLQQARREFADLEVQAQAKAMQVALTAGIREEASSFSGVVAEIRRGLLETERGTLTALEDELVQLSAQAGQDKQSKRVLAAVGQLEGHLCLEEGSGGGLDVLTRNNLLKAVFAEITIHPIGYKKKKTVPGEAEQQEAEQAAGSGGGPRSGPRGCLVMRLAGVDTPLPPVRLRRLKGKDQRLPSVAEWITDVYSLSPVEEGLRDPNVRARHTFYHVLRRVVESRDEADPLRQLMQAIISDKEFPKRSKGKETVAGYLAQNDIYRKVREHFEAAWTLYLEAERQRLEAKTDVRSE